MQVKKWGSSIASIIPKKTVDQLDLKPGDRVIADIKKQRGAAFGVWKGQRLPEFKRDRAEHQWA